MLNYSKHSINRDDRIAVVATMDSGCITRGPLVKAFEEAIADYVGARYAVACTSGTAALWLAYKGLKLDYHSMNYGAISTTTNTCAATIMPMLEQGVDVELRDIDPVTWQSSEVDIPVHLMGHPCKLPEKPCWDIEDAAHALGARYTDGNMVGSCFHSAATCFSFHPSKTITTGEGGMVTTNNELLANTMRALRDYGRLKKNAHAMVGLNFHMSEIQAALGLSQLERIDDFLEERAALASRYFLKLKGFPISLPKWLVYSSWHLFLIRIPQDKREQVGNVFQKAGIQDQVLYRCMHKQPFMNTGQSLPEAEAYEKECLALPLYPDLTHEEQNYVIETLEKALDG